MTTWRLTMTIFLSASTWRLSSSASRLNHATVHLEGLGSLEGKRVVTDNGTIALAYMGIPYAEPPVGQLRFEKPIVKRPWMTDDIGNVSLVCHDFKPACPQERIGVPRPYQSEDCLYLNVLQSPNCKLTNGSEICPVIYYVHGGMNEFDGPQDYPVNFLIDNFISRHIVFVTVAYRLGVLGFFGAIDDGVTANLALWDIRLGLKWVQYNIHLFGGNASLITVMGHSSGAGLVSALTLSPLTNEMFQQAIVMSGPVFMPRFVRNDVGRSSFTAITVGCNSTKDVEECLKKADLHDLLIAYNEFVQHESDPKALHTSLFMDGPNGFLPKSLVALANDRRPIPYMTGTTIREFTTKPPPDNTLDAIEQACLMVAEHLFVGSTRLETVVLECIRRFSPVAESNVSYQALSLAAAEIIDTFKIFLPTYIDAKTMAIAGAPVFLYEFEYSKPDVNATTPFHSFDLLYVMGLYLDRYNWTDNDTKMRELYVDLFCNFVKFGNPTPFATVAGRNVSSVSITIWQPLSALTGFSKYFVINLPEAKMSEKPYHQASISFWTDEAQTIIQRRVNSESWRLIALISVVGSFCSLIIMALVFWKWKRPKERRKYLQPETSDLKRVSNVAEAPNERSLLLRPKPIAIKRPEISVQ